jgi:hypothetical protein
MSYAVTWANIQQGLGQFTIDSTTLNSLEQRFYKLTFRTIKTSDNSQKPTYIDDNYGVPLDLEVLPGYYENVEGVPAENGYVVDGGAI